jgi:pilus assembly protein Flp/PilA
MNKFISAAKIFVQDEDGVTAIEYGLIAALIATALLIAVAFVTDGLKSAFQTIGQKMSVK